MLPAWALAVAVAGARAQTGPARDQVPPARLWTISDGLPQGTINEIVQAIDGEIWIATFGGLLRFDGVEFQTLSVDTVAALPSNRITSLAIDARETLWAATQGGNLLALRNGAPPQSLSGPLTGSEVVAMSCDSRGVLWLRDTDYGLHRYESGSWLSRRFEGSSGSYESLLLEADDSLWVAMGDRLLHFDARGELAREVPVPAPALALHRTRDGTFLVGMAGALGRLVGDSIVVEPVEPPLAETVRVIATDARGDVWLGTSVGLVHLQRDERGGLRQAGVPSGIPSPFRVRSLLCDREGNMWCGSEGQGLARFGQSRFSRVAPSALSNSISCIALDGAGGLWLGEECDDLVHVDAVGAERRWTASDFGTDTELCVYAILNGRNGRTWIATEHELWWMESDSWALQRSSLAFQAPAGPLLELLDGTLLASDVSGKVLRIDENARVLQRLDLGKAIRTMVETRDGCVWLGGPGILWRWCSGTLDSFDEHSGVPRGDLRHILPDDQGGLWLASYGGGLGYFSNRHGARLSSREGLPDSALSYAQRDGFGRLWLLSNRGLIVYEEDELRRTLTAGLPPPLPVVIGPEAGMPEATYGRPAGVRMNDGTMVFGTLAGAVRIDPARFPFNQTAPSVRIERAVTDDQVFDFSDYGPRPLLVLPAKSRRLEVDFTAFSFGAPERVLFRYRLEGFDEGWNDAGVTRSCTYTALRKGDYTLQIAARNEDGVWSPTSATLALRVLPAWYETRAFAVLATLASGLTILLFHRLRVQSVKRRATALLEATRGRAQAEARESRMREDLAHLGRVSTMESMASSLAHEVNQPLTAIVSNAETALRLLQHAPREPGPLQDILRDIVDQGQRASDVIQSQREFLGKRASQRTPVELHDCVVQTAALLRREVAENGVHLAFDLGSAEVWVEADRVQFQQVLVNLIKNACEALSNWPGPRRVEVTLTRLADRVHVDVRDSGPGLAPELQTRLFQPYVTNKKEGMGLGLSISRSIVEALGGRLSCEPRPDGGAHFRIDLPCLSLEHRTLSSP